MDPLVGHTFLSLTLADEDTNSILTDIAIREIQGNEAMQVARHGGQLWNQAIQVM